MSSVVTGLSDCLNCGNPLQGAYCTACGQKVTAVNPTLHDLLHDVSHELLHVDGKIFQSMRLLFTRPGFLSREHFDGRRTRYVAPLRLYLLFSVAYFGLLAASPPEHIVTEQDLPRAGWSLQSPGDSGLRVSGDFSTLGLTTAQVDERVREAIHRIPQMMFICVPLAALLVMAVTRRAGRNYPQHLYFVLHLHAAYFALLAASLLMERVHSPTVDGAMAVARLVLVLLYVPIAFRVAYGGNWALSIGRTAAFVTTYGVVVAVLLSALFVGAIFV